MFVSTHLLIVLVQQSFAMQKEKADPKALSTKLLSLGNMCKGNEETILDEMKKAVQDEDRTWAILHIITYVIDQLYIKSNGVEHSFLWEKKNYFSQQDIIFDDPQRLISLLQDIN